MQHPIDRHIQRAGGETRNPRLDQQGKIKMTTAATIAVGLLGTKAALTIPSWGPSVADALHIAPDARAASAVGTAVGMLLLTALAMEELVRRMLFSRRPPNCLERALTPLSEPVFIGSLLVMAFAIILAAA
ncbi:hypothetical protein [Azospirillum sp. sgz302134]